jgi:hypothetical protein
MPVTRRASPAVIALVCLGLLVPVVGVLLVLNLIPADDRPTGTPPTMSGPTGTNDPPVGTGPVHEHDYPETWDQPDDAPVVPDAELTQDEIDALVQSENASAGTTCATEQVTLSFRVVDAAAGTIFGYLVAEAVEPCALAGWPGLGARGEWGDPLPMQIDPEARDWQGSTIDGAPVPLTAGECALLPLRWSGERAGAVSQAASSAVVRLSEGSPAVLVPQAPKGTTDWVDWTIGTHLYPGAWQPDQGLCAA